jgi:hypothetical protein
MVIDDNLVWIAAEQLVGSGPYSGALVAGATSLFGRQPDVLTTHASRVQLVHTIELLSKPHVGPVA